MSSHLYSAYGHRLESSIPLPELRPAAAGPVRWTFRVVEDLPAIRDARLLGEERLYAAVHARLFAHRDGYRIVVDDTGAYDLSNAGRDIAWLPTVDPWWDFGRSHLIGRVLATSLQLSGTITLHASAVRMADGVVGFLAPKHFGKSTLAMALFRAGASFVTDDALPVDTSAGVLAHPGIQSLRVHAADENARWMLAGEEAPPAGRDGKIVLPPFPADHALNGPAPLSALYFLSPRVPAPESPLIERARVPAPLAAIRLVSQTKIGAMLGGQFAGPLMRQAATIANAVPVYDLALARDLDRLPEAIEALAEWHGLGQGPREDAREPVTICQ